MAEACLKMGERAKARRRFELAVEAVEEQVDAAIINRRLEKRDAGYEATLADTLAFSSSNRFRMRLMCVTGGSGGAGRNCAAKNLRHRTQRVGARQAASHQGVFVQDESERRPFVHLASHEPPHI
jgi:hypothetical protein